jgi:DNA-binding transcriptional ArsR family regulator
MDEKHTRISDPVRIRALAHPLRLELMDVLADAPATATECAEATGESVASCSFHLRMLAKYGYIEPDERRGREKPWRLVSPGRDLRPDDAEPESFRAVGEIAQVFVEHSAEGIRRWIAQLPTESPEWVHASTISGARFWATVEELAEFSQIIQNLTAPFEGRNDDPSLRPEGARPIILFASAHVDVVRERRSADKA